jgi:hypothetical protein
MEHIHFWQLPQDTGIKFDADFRRRFFSDAIDSLGGSNKVGAFLRTGKSNYSNNTKFKGSLIRHIKCARPGDKYEYCRVWVVVKLAKELGYSFDDIERHMVGYRGPIGYKVKKRFPIHVTPEFTALLAHMIGDGTDKKTKYGVGSYAQHNPDGLVNFCNKMENVFGKLETNPIFLEGESVYVPKLFLTVIKKHFHIDSFGTHESYVPPKIFYMNKCHRLAFLTALLVDEGAFYDTICFRVANKKLAEGVREVALSLGYKCSDNLIYNNSVGTTYGFSISNYSIAEFLEDIRILSRKAPLCNLVHKQKQLEYIAGLSRRSGSKRPRGETKKMILSAITPHPKGIIQISKETGVCRRTVRCHLQMLIKSGLVCEYDQNPKGAKLWKTA